MSVGAGAKRGDVGLGGERNYFTGGRSVPTPTQRRRTPGRTLALRLRDTVLDYPQAFSGMHLYSKVPNRLSEPLGIRFLFKKF